MTAREQAKKTLFCLYEATRIGEPIDVEITIIENALKEYASSEVAEMPTEEEFIEYAKHYAEPERDHYKRVIMSAAYIAGCRMFRNRMSKPKTGGEKEEYVDKSISIDEYMNMNPKLDPHEQDENETDLPFN